jgi:hypothetical protein
MKMKGYSYYKGAEKDLAVIERDGIIYGLFSDECWDNWPEDEESAREWLETLEETDWGEVFEEIREIPEGYTLIARICR